MRPFLLLIAGLVGGVGTAVAEPPGPRSFTAEDVAFFEAKVRPLLNDRCHSCHSTKAKKQKGGLLLDSRTSVLQGGDSGPAVVPEQPDKSLLMQAVRYQKAELQMPPKGKLSDRELAILEEWVRRGIPYPGPNDLSPAKSTVNLAEGRKFWSFQPPRMTPPPTTRDLGWAQRRIDSFLFAELDKRGLRPSPAASRRTLIRRATFDLIGLPPTPDEVGAFVNDPASDAYIRLIERLLASPQYGERWGRFWLDLARYADVTEPWSENKGQPYLYRDWVVQAFNDDLPYDQFVQRQLAADLMPEASLADRAALGYLGLSPTYWKELKLAPDVIQTVVAEEWEERIQAVSGTFLGLTVACARCHDHKFDPITTHDYYALAGIFASSRPTARPIRPPDFRFSILNFRLPTFTPGAAMDAAILIRQSQIENQKSTMYLAPAVDEASLHVLPDGPHRTKIEYQPDRAQDVAMQIRGNPANLGPMVPRHFLSVLSPDAPKPFVQGSGRLELARALVTEGAPLTARVLVNRVWKHHFGAGLVETPSDFGVQGTRPSHPELLDDLTARFVANGWSIKWLHREIMLAAVYQQASNRDERKHTIDPDNRFLWRMNRRRLEVEAWRDAMLAVTGTLSLEQGGPPTELGDSKNRRRTIYGIVKRRELSDLLRLNDFPDPTTHSPARVPTITPLQQLFTLNSPFLQQQAAALTRRLKADTPSSEETRIRRAYQLLFGRPVTDSKVKLAIEFLTGGKPDQPASEAQWEQYAQVLLGSNEFLFVD